MSCTNINFVSTLTSVTSQAEMEFILSKIRDIVSEYYELLLSQLTLTSTRARQSSSAGLTRTWRAPGAGWTTRWGPIRRRHLVT